MRTGIMDCGPVATEKQIANTCVPCLQLMGESYRAGVQTQQVTHGPLGRGRPTPKKSLMKHEVRH